MIWLLLLLVAWLLLAGVLGLVIGKAADRNNEAPHPMSVMCGQQFAACVCLEPTGHEPEPHECGCGGAWIIEDDGTPGIVEFPYMWVGQS